MQIFGEVVSMQIARGRMVGRPTERGSQHFSGTVWLDPVLLSQALRADQVFFEPAARTHWHRHEGGQVLVVTAGSGFVADRQGRLEKIGPGDVVFVERGELHWHGAAPDSYLIHLAIAIGRTDWLEAVGDDEYRSAVGEP